jgi:hypothetical protein
LNGFIIKNEAGIKNNVISLKIAGVVAALSIDQK